MIHFVTLLHHEVMCVNASKGQASTNVSSLLQPTDYISFEGIENSTKNITEPSWTSYQYFQYSFNFVLITIYVLILLGNLLTVSAVINVDNLHRKPTNILILSLAIADGLLSL